jgi:DNA replicative helicase MCM subunit Mcm2 (Cdc46/Mcm family)
MSRLSEFKSKNLLINLLDSKLFENESQKNQILLIISENKKLTRKEVTTILQNRCYPVTNVTYVTQKKIEQGGCNTTSEFIGNKSNKGNRVTLFESLLGSVKVTINRLVESELIDKDKSSKEHIYSLSDLGEESIILLLKEDMVRRKRVEEKENKHNFVSFAYSVIEDYYTSIRSSIINSYSKGNIGVTRSGNINLLKMAEINPDIAEYFLDNPTEAIRLSKLVLSEILSREGIESEANITISNAPKSCRKSITNIRVADLDKMINVIGEIRSRSKSHIQINSITYECPACGGTKKLIQDGNKEKKLKKCPNCGYTGNMIVKSTEKDDFLKLTIYDLYENLSSNEVPEELNIYLQKDLYGFSFLQEGERVEITGVAFSENKTDAKGNHILFQEKIFQGYGIKKLDNAFTDDLISAEDDKIIKEISKNPIEYHKKLLFPDLDDVDLPATVASICLYGNHNILFVGNPGCGKTEITRRIADISLKGKFANCATSSSSGILGSVTKNEFTGKYTLDGGVFRPVHPGGNVVLDEINRDHDKDLQKAILGVMNDKRININKANTRIDEACAVSVWCNANPLSDSNYKKPHDRFGLLEPLYDRFDLVVYFTNELDWGNLDLVESILDKEEFKSDTPEIMLLKKYQLKAQTIDVKIDKNDNKKLALIMKTILPKFGEKLSYRKLKTVVELLKSICRIHLRDHTTDEDYKILTDIYSRLHLQKTEFNKSDYSEVF